MRKIFTTLKSVVAATLVAAMTLAVSCSYDDTGVKNEIEKVKADVAELTERVAALEKRLTDEVAALQALVNGKVVVTGVETDADGVTTVTLSDGKSFKVYPEATFTDTDTDTYVSVKEDNGVLYWAFFDKDDNFIAWLEINGEKVAVYDGNDDTDTIYTPSVPQFRVAENGETEISIDGGITWVSTGLSAAAISGSIFSDVVLNEDGTVTFYLTNGGDFTVVKAELIEFDQTRGQVYVKNGEVKEIGFSINDAVVDINVMNQPMGWKATVEEVVADEPEAEVLAAGGKDYVLKVTGPKAELVKSGVAEKEGVVSIHFNTAAGACKVLKLEVNLAEITVEMDKTGHMFITNTVVDSYLYEDWWGNSELVQEFNNYYIAVMNLDDYTEDLASIYNANWGEFNVPCAGGWVNNFYSNVNDRNPYVYYEEGVCEKFVFDVTVEELINALDYYGNLSYEGNSFMVLVIPTDPTNGGTLILDQAIATPFKQLAMNIEAVESECYNVYFDVTLRGGVAYNVLPMSLADVEEYLTYGYESAEAYFYEMMMSYLAQPNWSTFGFRINTDVNEEKIGIMDLISYTLDYEPYFEITPGTDYILAYFAEEEGKAVEEYTAEDLKYTYFSTADLVKAETPAEYTIEYGEDHSYTRISVDITVPENTVASYSRFYTEEQLDEEYLMDDLLGYNGFAYTDFENGYTYSAGQTTTVAGESMWFYLLIVNENGEYTLVGQEVKSKEVVLNSAEVSIASVDFVDQSATITLAGVEGLEISAIKYFMVPVDASSYYNKTEEQLQNIAYGSDWMYKTATANPFEVSGYLADYSYITAGKTYRLAVGVQFADGTVSAPLYGEYTYTIQMEDVVATKAWAKDSLLETEGSTCYQCWVYFELPSGDEVRISFGTGEDSDTWYGDPYYGNGSNMYVNVGQWDSWAMSTNGVWYNGVYFNGVEIYPYNEPVQVGYNENGYTFEFTVDKYNVTYAGPVEGLEAPANYVPGEGGDDNGDDSGDEGGNTGAGDATELAVAVCSVQDWGGGDYYFYFADAGYTWTINWDINMPNGFQAGTYTLADTFPGFDPFYLGEKLTDLQFVVSGDRSNFTIDATFEIPSGKYHFTATGSF